MALTLNEAQSNYFISSFGVPRNATVSNAVSSVVMPANEFRTKLIIKNDTANNVWINLSGAATAVAGSGNMKIASGGGYFELDGFSGAVNAIAETAPSDITAREW